MRREFRLMIAITHDQERLPGKLLLQACEKAAVIVRAHRLPAQIFIDHGLVAGRAPWRRQVAAKPRLPGEVVGGEIDEGGHGVAGGCCAIRPSALS